MPTTETSTEAHDDHEHHAGKACTFDGGACTGCGVSESGCDACGGVGYHADGCAQIDG